MNECADPDGQWEVPQPVRCQRGTALARSQAAYLGSLPKGQDAVNTYPENLLWSVKRK